MTPSFRIAFREWFGLAPSEAAVLIELYVAKGDAVTQTALASASGIALRSVQNCIVTLRLALDSEAIDYERSSGYRLTDAGLAECRAALWTVGEELRGAA